MGLLSKLFGKTVEDAAADMFGSEKHYFDNLRSDDAPPQPPKPAAKKSSAPPPRGNCPWGELMPAEENQYSFNGSYIQYFEKIFGADFSSYQISHAPGQGRSIHHAEVFTFMNGGRVALIVELMSEKSSSRALRDKCQRDGVPYLRFYYDHDGWWNARSYVTDRVRARLSV